MGNHPSKRTETEQDLMTIKEPLFYVADSQIHGKGLFARKYIGAGEIIGVLDCIPTSTDGEHVFFD